MKRRRRCSTRSRKRSPSGSLHESFPDDAEERGVLKLADIVGRVQQRLAAAAKSG